MLAASIGKHHEAFAVELLDPMTEHRPVHFLQNGGVDLTSWLGVMPKIFLS